MEEKYDLKRTIYLCQQRTLYNSNNTTVQKLSYCWQTRDDLCKNAVGCCTGWPLKHTISRMCYHAEFSHYTSTSACIGGVNGTAGTAVAYRFWGRCGKTRFAVP